MQTPRQSSVHPPAADPTAEAAALDFLTGRIDYERSLAVPYGKRDFRLDRMHDLLARLGNPQDSLKVVHLAGTKGKGSTAAMIAAVLTAAGYRTGLYSSPHLDRVEERLAIDGLPCPPAELVELVEVVRPVIEAMDAESEGDPLGPTRPTYFETVTALALLHFARQRVDAAVLEVGMGGRLDSTNVCRPIVTVITSISFDHTQQLGNTLAAIAGEKAGIIKPGVPLVSGVLPEEPRAVVLAAARAANSRVVELEQDFSYVYRAPQHLERLPAQPEFDYIDHRDAAGSLSKLQLSLVGRHQAANAALALATLGELRCAGYQIPESAVRRGLSQVSWPARVEVLRRLPAIVLDAAHNVASVEALVQVLQESFSAQRRLLVFATTRDKNLQGMLERLLPAFDEVIFTRYWSNPRGVPAEELDALAAEISSLPRTVCADATSAWTAVQARLTPDDLVCIAGSFFIAAEMRAAMRAAEPAR
jgi:dihydrofolate synthase/folylpolyglutamate synthase